MEMIDNGEGFDHVLCLDFRKAFDTVPHARSRIVNKLKAHGVDGKVPDWIADFLKGRRQRVSLSINDNYSCWMNVLSGIPQGSVSDPILFIIFINDLPDVFQILAYYLHCKLHKGAWTSWK